MSNIKPSVEKIKNSYKKFGKTQNHLKINIFNLRFLFFYPIVKTRIRIKLINNLMTAFSSSSLCIVSYVHISLNRDKDWQTQNLLFRVELRSTGKIVFDNLNLNKRLNATNSCNNYFLIEK